MQAWPISHLEDLGVKTPEPTPKCTSNFDGKNFIPCAIWKRDKLSVGRRIEGPAIIEEGASTTLVGPKDRATVDRIGNIHITVGSDQ